MLLAIKVIVIVLKPRTHFTVCQAQKVFCRFPQNTLQTESHGSRQINGDFNLCSSNRSNRERRRMFTPIRLAILQENRMLSEG